MKAIVPLEAEVRGLSAAQKQLVEIAKALGLGAKLIIFDEPTASLSPSEVERLFDIMGRLREDGRGLVFVSHRLEEVFAITDRVTILREGRTVLASHETAALTQAELIRHMVGQELGAIYAGGLGRGGTAGGHGGARGCGARGASAGARHLLLGPPGRDPGARRPRGRRPLGSGRGRSSACGRASAARIRIDGRAIEIRKPGDAIRAGIGFVAEDRRSQNIVPDMSVKENLLLAHLGAHRGFGRGYAQRETAVQTLLTKLGLPPERLLDANMLNFSGGMQQKIIIARWLLLEPKILILDEPTKGVDIGTRSSIYAMLREIAEKGVAVVIVSSDFEELLGVSDRVVVVSDGLSVADCRAPCSTRRSSRCSPLRAPPWPRTPSCSGTLAEQSGGAGFWALIEDDQADLPQCRMRPMPRPTRASRPGTPNRCADTRIPVALRPPRTDLRRRSMAATGATVLVPLRSARGHDMGWVGLTVPGTATLPSAEAIRARVEALSRAS